MLKNKLILLLFLLEPNLYCLLAGHERLNVV